MVNSIECADNKCVHECLKTNGAQEIWETTHTHTYTNDHNEVFNWMYPKWVRKFACQYMMRHQTINTKTCTQIDLKIWDQDWNGAKGRNNSVNKASFHSFIHSFIPFPLIWPSCFEANYDWWIVKHRCGKTRAFIQSQGNCPKYNAKKVK